MIKRVTKKIADFHIEKHMHDDNYPISVIIAGNGRYYTTENQTTEELQTYLKELKASKGGELPSFLLEEEDGTDSPVL